MPASRTPDRSLCRSSSGWIAVVAIFAIGIINEAAAADKATQEAISLGKELFAREWVPNDPRCHAGDGLGPAYNETSCIGCHNQGGPGGAGTVEKNVDLLTLRFTTEPIPPKELSKYHPGFRRASTLLLHRFGTDPEYKLWRLTRVEGIEDADLVRAGGASEIEQIKSSVQRNTRSLIPAPRLLDRAGLNRVLGREPAPNPVMLSNIATLSQRNPPQLFGAGLIDSISSRELQESCEKQLRAAPEVAGRLSTLPNGQIGRFGWKCQIATLDEFVLSACANELGLETPGHLQAELPLPQPQKIIELDLTREDCNALTAYVGHLPAPGQRRLSGEAEVTRVKAGRTLFATVGCAVCHTPNVGSVEGIYSDLLLHSMGEDLADSGNYYGASGRDRTLTGARPARPAEWRTPPLWGFRDSGPYLHDGRAATLEQAVALHGGQGEASAEKFFALGPPDRQLILTFLNTLTAPPADRLP